MNLYGDLPKGDAPVGLVVEHGAENKPAINLLNKFGANIKESSENTVLQFNKSTAFSKQNLAPTQTETLLAKGNDNSPQIQPNIYVVSWTGTDRRQRLMASFTEAVSTFTGSPVVRVQLVSNGKLVRGTELTKALKSLFAARQKEIFERKWIASSLLRIHAVNEPIVAATIQDIGGSKRLLGSFQMMSAVVKFKNIPSDRLGIELSAPMPFDVVVRPTETKENLGAVQQTP